MANASTQLFEKGTICPERADNGPVEIWRGMTILTRDEREAGRVAAVVVDNRSRAVTHLLLVRTRRVPEYRLAPVEMVEQVSQGAVRLNVAGEVLETLPPRLDDPD